MKRFNELGLSIAIITTLQTGELALAVAEFEAKKSSLKTKLHGSKNPLEKSQIKATLDEMEHLGQPIEFLTAFAKERNLQHDPAWVASLNVIMEVFRPDTYEISISLPDQQVPVAFRGVIDKRGCAPSRNTSEVCTQAQKFPMI